jgi:hypothetical protein
MKPNRMMLVLVAIAAVAVAIAPTLVQASADGAPVATGQEPAAAQAADATPTTDVQAPVPASIPPPINGCHVTRNCAYPPPSSISCSSVFVHGCSQGSDGYGWVECDGLRTYCSGPFCTGAGTACFKDSDCYYPGVCTCGPGTCSDGFCSCPSEPIG